MTENSVSLAHFFRKVTGRQGDESYHSESGFQ